MFILEVCISLTGSFTRFFQNFRSPPTLFLIRHTTRQVMTISADGGHEKVVELKLMNWPQVYFLQWSVLFGWHRTRIDWMIAGRLSPSVWPPLIHENAAQSYHRPQASNPAISLCVWATFINTCHVFEAWLVTPACSLPPQRTMCKYWNCSPRGTRAEQWVSRMICEWFICCVHLHARFYWKNKQYRAKGSITLVYESY